MRRSLWPLVLLGVLSHWALGGARLVASAADGWPQWRGPRRDGICLETGLLDRWPEGGPRLIWKTTGIGRGYSAPIVVRDTIYITGDVGDEVRISALDLDGKLKWRTTNGRAWKRSFRGSRAACTFDQGRLYHLNAHGRLACLDASDGKELWAVNIVERFGGKVIFWGLSEAPLIYQDKVIATAGGAKGLVVALDKRTGATIWASRPLRYQRTHAFGRGPLPKPRPETARASYASPILVELGGKHLVLGCASEQLYCVDADTGELYWSQPMPTRWEVLAVTPALWRDAVFVTGPHGEGGKMFRIVVQGDQVRAQELWRTTLDTCHGGVVVVGDRIFGSWYRSGRGWACLDARTGRVLYRTEALAMGSVLWAEGLLYCLSQRGEMALLRPTESGFEFRGRFRLTDGRRADVWTHPVIAGRRLYLRYHDALWCYDIARPAR